MATVKIDTLRDLSAEERGGFLFGCTRSVLVSGLDPSGYENDDTIRVVLDALDAADTGSQGLTIGSCFPENVNLLLVGRDVRMTDPGNAEVTLRYVHISETDLQDLANPASGFLVFHCSASLENVETSVDHDGNPIWVKYLYPDGGSGSPAPDSGNLPASTKHAGQTIYQGGRINVRVPVKRLTLTGLLAFDDPDAVVDGILGLVNDDGGGDSTGDEQWQGAPPGCWICAAADYVIFDATGSPKTYKYSFVFEKKYDGDFDDGGTPVPLGWQPQAVFIDDETGKPPPDWKAAGAYLFVNYYLTTHFKTYFSELGIAGAGE